MEHNENVVQTIDMHTYQPLDYEKERASNSYLMSFVALMAGAPLPVINMLATLFFFLANRKSTPYVRWHCTQALLSQLTVFVMNAVAFTWTMRIIFGSLYVTDNYIGYMLTVLCFNIFEFIITVVAAIKVRKGKHIEWWFWGALTNQLSGKKIPMSK
ncbi:MAG: DUF4870 domain-containing protein [Taibaiella sp.]|nr:DUF4870 domain-containing protein [Taibaiella sp.]